MNWKLIPAILILAIATLTLADQGYSPKPGQTVMKVAIEGRGNVYVELYTTKASKTTAHIIDLAKRNFYDNLRFHKVVKSPRPYIAQVGDPNSKDGDLNDPEMGTHGSGARIPYEDSGYSHEEGSVALASPPKDKDGGDSQFFFVLASSKFLDGKYTVFGKVVQGQSVMQSIEKGDRIESISIERG
jgi:peptidyl-prolyl cis-trans isomerase B (cyclophilin B)